MNSLFFMSVSLILIMMMILMSSGALFLSSGGEVAVEWVAFSSSGQKIILLLVLDFMSLVFLSTVSLISGCVFFYSSSYMSGDMYNPRFGGLVMFFVLSMALMILSPNLISLLLGWDGLGVTSYLLVCYYMSEKSFNASMLTALTNRIGDVAILICISLWVGSGFFNYGLLSSSSLNYLTGAIALIILASMTKSAQIPFSAWLPAAMAAPTPVSALVHSSTLVTAGVYFLIRMNFVLQMSGWAPLILILGLLTMTMAGAAAVYELDMKKVVALSTLSQLGVMFFSLGLGQPFMAFFHLISHAYFKAMLFMAAGAIIHSMKDYQDLRKMGGASSSLVCLSTVCLVSNLSLCGFPFMSGFYSKDMILEFFFMGGPSTISFFLALMATGLTVVYSCRFIMLVFNSFSSREDFSLESDGDKVMVGGITLLMAPAIMGGWWLSGLNPSSVIIFIPIWQKMCVLILVVFSSLLMLSGFSISLGSSIKSSFLHEMWFMPLMFSPALTKFGLISSKSEMLSCDNTWLKYLSWQGVVSPRANIFYMSSVFRSMTLSSLVILGFTLMIL